MVEEKNSLSREQKIGFILLLIFAITGLSLGFLQIRNTMLKPFALTNTIPSTVKEEVNDISALRFRDTDSDGLNDYEELYIDGTSPYLYDTFSYGFSDKEVVERGLPRCPNAGENCLDAGTVIASSSSKITPPSSEDATAVSDLQNLLTNPSEMRKLLIQSGVEKEVLDKISDQDLINMAIQILSSSSTPITQ